MMADVGCGSGQITFPLSPLCQRIVGANISPAQMTMLKNILLKKASSAEFKAASSYQLPFSDESVSMLMCEYLAAFGYLHPRLNDKQCKTLCEELFSVTLKDYWHDSIKIIRSHTRISC